MNILLVEDQENEIFIMEKAAKEIGHGLLLKAVRDGEEATEYLLGKGRYSDRLQFPIPNVLVTDLNMPRMDGLELLRWLQKRHECDDIPKIVLSNSATKEDMAEAYRLGANSCLVKPEGFDASKAVLEAIRVFWSQTQLPGPTEMRP